jgi:hypothetical protein
LLVPVLRVLFVVVTLLGVATLRVLYSGEAELNLSTAALDAGDAREAIVRARRAARWYAPGAPHVGVAYDRLIALGVAAEQSQQDDLALLAWRGVRVAVIETRWVTTPFPEHLERADQEMAKQPKVLEPDARIRAEALAKLRRHEPPRVLWVALLVTGFVSLATGLGLWARQVGAAGGRLDWGKAKVGVALSVVGAVLWLLAVWRA